MAYKIIALYDLKIQCHGFRVARVTIGDKLNEINGISQVTHIDNE